MAPRADAPSNTAEEAREDPKAPNVKTAPKKIYIPIRIRTNALNNDDIAINAAYISLEDLQDARDERKARGVEIRYLDSIKSFRDKIKSSYSCSQDHCPMIRERLDQHQLEHHQDPRPLARCCSNDRHYQQKSQTMDFSEDPNSYIHRVVSGETRNQKSVAISPAASILKRTRNNCTESQSQPNSSKCVDFNHTTQNSFETHLFKSDRQTQHSRHRTTVVDNETAVTPKNSFLREDLQEEIQKWFDDIPIYPSLTSSLKNLRKNMTHEFIDKIFILSNDVNAVDYERNVKAEVDNFLNALPMWYPGAKRDQDLLKEGIKNNLLNKIKGLRDKSDNISKTVKYVDDTVNTDGNISLRNNKSMNQIEPDGKEKIIESEVLDWLMQIKFKESDEIGRTINIIDATDIFTKRLIPLLDKPSATKNYKLILKGLIVDTLNDLPNILHYPKNKRVYLNRIAEDLANRLIGIQTKYNKYFNCCFPRDRSMYQMAVCSKSSLKQTLLDGLNDCLQTVSIEHRNDIKEEITDILIDCLESVRFKEDIEDKDELINKVLGKRSFEISETQTSDITIENIRDILAGNIINAEYDNKNLMRSCHSGTTSIFTSEHDLSNKYPVTSTPKQNYPNRLEPNRLNKEEIAYMDRVGLLIRNWMETLPRSFREEEEKTFKEVMIKDLAGDIMDQIKLEQLAPKTVPDRDKFMFYIIFRWLFRFEVYEDLNDATPQIEDLVMRLHEIPVPTLTMPQRGNRQAMSNIKHMEGDRGWEDEFVPESADVLEDEISIWMNEQPPEIYSIKDKEQQSKMVHELAGTVKNKINNKENDLDNDLSKWLKIMLKSSKKDEIDKLSRDLKDRIMKISKEHLKTGHKETNSTSPSTSSSNSSSKPTYAKASGSDTSQDAHYKKQKKKGVVSNSWFSCNCPLEPKDSKSGSEQSQDSKSSDNTQKIKQAPHSGMTGNKPSESDSKTFKDSVNKYKQGNKNNSNISSTSIDIKTVGSGMKHPIPKTQQKANPKKPGSDTSSKTSGSETSKGSKRADKKQQSSKPTKKAGRLSKGSDKKQSKKNSCVCPKDALNPKSTPNIAKPVDNDKTLIEYIGKFMEHNNDVDDNTTKGVYGEILKAEFRKLDPPTRKEVYDNFSKDKSLDDSSPERLSKELQYIKDMSDWLKNIPIDSSFNTPHYKERIEFVNDLAKKIYEVEENRRNEPAAMDYNTHLASIIKESVEKLPILPEHTENVPLMVDQLVSKVIASRTPMPCCMAGNETSMNTTGIPEQNISEFIDHYIRLNAGDIANDPVKLEAWTARVLKEAKKIIRDSSDPSTLCKTQVYNKLVNISIPEEESVRLFGLELDYAKEISEWLNNLPLLPMLTPEASEKRVKMISELAEKFSDREKNKIINPDETQSNQEIEEYLTKWTQELPLDSNRSIVMPVVVQQLLKRIDRVNRGPQEIDQATSDQSTNTPKKGKSKGKSKSSKTCRPSCCSSGGKAGELVVEAIETWSNSLPVKAENKEAEKSIKDGVARQLFQKVGDLSVDPQTMNNDMLYQELLTDEIDNQLNSLLKSADMQKKKDSLKKSLVDKVMEAKSLAKESTAGENYKQQLETTIDASIPNPISTRQTHDPGFQIYKNRVAEMFILENFDHGNDEVKLKYEKRIKKEIDKYCEDAQARNAIPLSKEQIYSELYGALFNVPSPSESATTEEVEEIKTRCEISDWFEDLPLQETCDGNEMLKRDQVQSMLAKRLREIETREQKPDEKMHKEIAKWLTKLPLQPGNEQNVDELADDLQNKLKATKEDRKRVPPPPFNTKDKSKTKGILGTSQIAGPSSAGYAWSSPLPSSQVCCQQPSTPKKKAADVMLEIIENWCQSLPFYENTQKNRDMNAVIREDLGTKIIIKICELNSDPQTFSDSLLYNYLLDQELEKLMANLPICCDFEPTKNYKKTQLLEAINSVKPLIKEEKARHEYKKDLNETVNSFLKEPLDTTTEIMALFNQLREEIVDNFIQYHYNRDDDEGKQIYKAKLRDAVLKYFLEIQDKPEDLEVDPLMKQNQLLCELAKISIPNEEAIKDEVEEIRMKDNVKQFFEEHSLNEESEENNAAVNNIKLSLAKRLNELEKTGHNCVNDAKMKKEISRYLTKIDKDVSAKDIESFVENLKVTEAARKAPPIRKDDTNCSCLKSLNQSQYQDPNEFGNMSRPANACNASKPACMSNLQGSTDTNSGTRVKLCCPQAYNDARSLGVTPVEYQGFGGGVAISSSPQVNGQPNMTNVCPNHSQLPIPDTSPMNQGEGSDGRFTPHARKREKMSDNEGTEEECKCMAGKARRKMRGKPRCVLRRAQFCDDCDDYGPMWMPMPSYRFPPGYFYF